MVIKQQVRETLHRLSDLDGRVGEGFENRTMTAVAFQKSHCNLDTHPYDGVQ